MTLNFGILFGIITMLSWGISDFFAAKSSRKIGALKTIIWSQIISVAIFTSIFIFFFRYIAIPAQDIIIATASGFLGVIGLASLYKGFEVGSISIISPIASSSAVVTVVLSMLVLGEKISAIQKIGVALAIIGTVLASVKNHRYKLVECSGSAMCNNITVVFEHARKFCTKRLRIGFIATSYKLVENFRHFKIHDLIKLNLSNLAAGVKYGFVAMFAFGVSYVLMDILVQDLGWFVPVFLIKILGLAFIIAFAAATKKEILFPKKVTNFVFIVGALETIAFLSVGAGISLIHTSIVIPLASAFPAVTIVLAKIFFREQMETNQKIGVAAVLAGMVLLFL